MLILTFSKRVEVLDCGLVYYILTMRNFMYKCDGSEDLIILFLKGLLLYVALFFQRLFHVFLLGQFWV